eukprot:gene24434-30779_t
MAEALRGKIKALAVDTPQGHSGKLLRESQYVFNYDTQDRQAELALGMPLRAASYNSSQPHPIFAMNLPEGNLRHKIRERYGKAFSKLDDMSLLSIVGHDQIGRLTVVDPTEEVTRPGAGVGLRELLGSKASDELFDHLLDTYLASGVSGVQPKVMVPDADASSDGVAAIMHTTARLSDLIVKASSIQHENLTQNEFLCMDAAKRAGIDVPEFHLSDDGSLFVVRRFDRTDTGERKGFEDMSVLAGLTYNEYGSYKYEGSYENIATIIEAYCGPNATESKQRFFDYFCLSTMVRNGDAHLKNFGLDLIARIDHGIGHAGQQTRPVVGGDKIVHCIHQTLRVDRGNALTHGLNLGLPGGVGQGMNLTVDVGLGDVIHVDERQTASAAQEPTPPMPTTTTWA